jgi:cytoskeletal protein RodZ
MGNVKTKEKEGDCSMQEKNTSTRKILIGVVAVVVLAIAFWLIYGVFGAKSTAGAKEITIEVIDDQQQSTTYDVQTDAEYLRQAMEESDLEFSGSESDYGMMVETVNGVTADYDADGAYWAFYVDGEYCNYGIDSQPIEDGEAYQIVYTVDGM